MTPRRRKATPAPDPTVDLELRMRLVEEHGEELLFAEGFDEAILGVSLRCGQTPYVLYDRDRCIDVLTGLGLSLEDAEEHFSFNVSGSWVGEHTPGFVVVVERT